MREFLYYCRNCDSLIAVPFDNGVIPCETCGEQMTALFIDEDEWNAMTIGEKRDLLERYRKPSYSAGTYVPSDMPERYDEDRYGEDQYEQYPENRENFLDRLKSINNIHLYIAAGVAALLIIILIVSMMSGSKASALPADYEAPAAEEAPASEYIEVEAPPEEDYQPEQWAEAEADDVSGETASETINLSDGPIFERTDFHLGEQDVHLFQYSMKDGQIYEIAHFKVPDMNYRLAVGLKDFTIAPFIYCESTDYIRRKLFDTRLERLAVEWIDRSNSSNHVGWIDRNGNITDVSEIVHPITSEFSSVLPKDSRAFFTSDDRFVFYDGNDKKFCYFKDGAIVETYTDESINDNINGNIGLDLDDRPFMIENWSRSSSVIQAGGKMYGLFTPTNSMANDYAICDAGYVFLWADEHAIGHYGPGITEIVEPSSDSGSPEEACYTSRGDGNKVYITDETEYTIEDLVYSDNTIVFTGSRGTDRALFKMPYVNGTPGEPELMRTIDKTWGHVLFWEDSDTEVTVSGW